MKKPGKFDRIDQKTKLNFLFCFVVTFVIIAILFFNGLYTQYKYVAPKTLETVSLEQLELVNIDRSGQNFTVTGKDNYFIYNTSQKIQTVKIKFLSTKEDANYKIYYALDQKTFNESKRLNFKVTGNEVIIGIPKEGVTSIRINTDKDFVLESIETSTELPLKEEVSTSSYQIGMFISMNLIISCIITLVLVYFRMVSRLKNYILSFKDKTKLLKYIKRGTILVVTSLLLLGAQFFFTAQFRVTTIDGTFINSPRIYFTIAVSIMFWGSIWLRKCAKNHLEKAFILASLTAGILFAMVTPIFQEVTWDAGVHYNLAEPVAYLAQETHSELDKQVGILENSYNLQDVRHITDKYNEIYAMSNPVAVKDASFLEFFTLIGYIPLSIGMFVAKGLSLSFSTSIVLAKLLNAVFYSVITYFAIKRLHYGKTIMFIIAMYPTVLMLSAAYSYDPWVIAFLMLGSSYLFSAIQEKEKPLSKKEAFIIIGSFFIGCAPKAIYFPILLLCFLLPKSKFKTKNTQWIFYGVVVSAMIFLMISFILPMLMSASAGASIGDFRGGEGINSVDQIIYILTNPLEYAKTLLLFLKDYWGFANAGMYITRLGYMGQLPIHYINVAMMIIVLICGDREKEKLNWVKKGYTVVLMFGISCLVATALYISFTAVGMNYINGCQARYLLPLLFPAAYALKNTYKPLKVKKEYINTVAYLISTGVVYLSILTIVWNYSVF